MARNVISRRLEADFRNAEAAVEETGKTLADLIMARRRDLERAEDAAEMAALIYIVAAAFIGLCCHFADLSIGWTIGIELAVAACAAGLWYLLRRER